MKLKKSLIFILAFVFFGNSMFLGQNKYTVYATEIQDSSTDLVRDGGFEAATGAKKEGITSSMGEGPLKIGTTNSEWYYSSGSASKYKINLEVVSDENVARSGSNAMKASLGDELDVDGTTGSARFQQRDITGLTEGKKYLFSTYVKVVGETPSGSLQVKADSTTLVNWKSVKNATDWTAFTCEFEASSTSISRLNFIVNGSPGCYWLFDDISIVQVPILTIENVNLEAGKSTVINVGKDDPHTLLGTTPTYTWESSDDTIATVDENGNVTAVGTGTATITVTAACEAVSTKRVSAICAVTVTPVVSVNGQESAGTLQKAIDAAASGDTIKLLKDITSEDVILLSKGTLDLNGKTLTAPSLTAFSGANVVDSSTGKTGLLKVTNFKPDDDNDQMPIYNGTGYVFIDFEDLVKQEEGSTVSEDVFKLVFKPLFGTTNTALGSLGAEADVSFRIRLKWTDENDVKQTKDLYWSSDLIKQVYHDSMAFSVTASGVSKYKGLTITPLIQSTLNPEIEWLVGSEHPVNPVN